ncbi:2Fe-2S iron-sulfur cluster-binding protein [Streptomyces broussonetiae]|uniref:2Fe-2S iron-sulfur cluster-binding protein n=1 Tax=Streptomyces broussonetiae TaxID=2686304 RepID=UPI0035DBF7A4
MTDDQHGEGTPQGGGRWDPLPQGDYDDGATAFVKLPEGGIDALLSGDSPLAAPGHGYVPPRITAAPGTGDPAAPGTWAAPASGTEWPDPNAVAQAPGADDRFTYEPAATQQWTFEEPAAPAAPGHDVTGQWSIPVAGGDLPDESGEFTTSSLVEQWGGTPPPTLPGGAPAPWAAQDPGRPWDHPEDRQPPAHPLPDHTGAHPAGGAAAQGYVPQEPYARDESYATDERYAHDAAGHDPAGHGRAERGPAGHGPVGHADAGPARTVHADAAPVRAGRPAEFAEFTEPAAPAGITAPPAEPEAAPDANGHGPAQAPERLADGPAGHEDPATPAAGPRAATTPVTPAAVDAEATAAPATPEDLPAVAGDEEAAAPEHPADAPGAAVPAADDTPGGDTEAAGDEAAREAAVAEKHTAPLPPGDDHPLASYVLRVNSTDRPVTDAWIGESLLYVLRERLGLAGAKDGCSQGECGACNVQVDGRLVASCLVPAVTAAGSEVRTVEGLAADGRPSDVQRALARCGAVQCGFCVPGMAMTVHDLLEGNPAPTELEARQALCGNLCRCSGYRGVLQAVQEVVAEREASHAAEGTDTEEARIPHQAGPGSGGVHPSAFEAPGAFDTPQPAPGGYGGTPDPYGSPEPYGTPGPHDPRDQHYGQDGGQV